MLMTANINLSSLAVQTVYMFSDKEVFLPVPFPPTKLEKRQYMNVLLGINHRYKNFRFFLSIFLLFFLRQYHLNFLIYSGKQWTRNMLHIQLSFYLLSQMNDLRLDLAQLPPCRCRRVYPLGSFLYRARSRRTISPSFFIDEWKLVESFQLFTLPSNKNAVRFVWIFSEQLIFIFIRLKNPFHKTLIKKVQEIKIARICLHFILARSSSVVHLRLCDNWNSCFSHLKCFNDIIKSIFNEIKLNEAFISFLFYNQAYYPTERDSGLF